jgi:glycosyltransferase involved in cell wall biosynthesis
MRENRSAHIALEKNATEEAPGVNGRQYRQVSSPLSGNGPLDGRVILRFAHAFESGGGTERYLDDLDNALLERSALTIIRLHLTRNPSPAGPTEQPAGRGRLVRIPLPIVPGGNSPAASDEHSLRFRMKQRARNWVLYNPLVWSVAGARWTASLRLPPESGQAIGAGSAAEETLRTQRVDLAVLHFFGGSDADEVVNEARKARVPIALLHHYSNDRLMHLAIRKHAMVANAIAGVNGLGVPRYLRDRFINLSDGIDTEFFHRANARPLANPPSGPIILLPARVVREKGQLDLVRAVSSLRKSGMDCCIAFAGRADDADFVDELRREIAQVQMTECVQFLGNISVEELRDWYAASAVVAFPTYHHEGLPRVIIEAQSMGVPVVAYATGGVAEGIASGKTGCLLPTGDVSGLVNCLRELLSSPALRASMGSCGREAAENRFSLSAMTDRHERFYAQVISDSQAGGGKPSTGQTRQLDPLP